MTSADGRPALSVIVVNWNTRDLLKECLSSVMQHLAQVPFETIVVDNASSDGSADMVEASFRAARLIRSPENIGFGPGNNLGMSAARGRVFLLLNSDARVLDGALVRLLERLDERPDVGVIGPRLRYEDGRLQASAHRFDSLSRLAVEELGLYKLLGLERTGGLLLGGYWNHEREREVDWLMGACLLVRREVFEETGGFDPGMFLYGEEVEWCHRIRDRGWKVLFCPRAEVVHRGHASSHQLLGEVGRIERCLTASDQLMRRRRGPVSAVLAGALRVLGAAGKCLCFRFRRALWRDDDRGRAVIWNSRIVLRHYLGPGFARVVSGPSGASRSSTRANPDDSAGPRSAC